MNIKLKNIIFRKLYEDLSHVEIIYHNNSIWFIDRENKYWYFEYQKSGHLWWRYGFFSDFFYLFSIERNEYESIMSEWVEEVLNCKVNTTARYFGYKMYGVEEVLNCKVNTTGLNGFGEMSEVEEVLNCKVNATVYSLETYHPWVEEVLNYKVDTTGFYDDVIVVSVEEVLNHKVETNRGIKNANICQVEDVLGMECLPNNS